MIMISDGIRRFVFAAVAAGGVVASTAAFAQSGADTALTASENLAVAEMLNQVNALSGAALQAEVGRLAKQYADQNLNLSGIIKAVETAAPDKEGAVKNALSAACGGASGGAVCQAVAVSPNQEVGPGRTNVATGAGGGGTANIQTAAAGGGGGGGGAVTTPGFTGPGAGAGSGTSTGSGSGSAVVNNAAGSSVTSGGGGTQSASTSYATSVTRSASSVGTSTSPQ